MTRWFGPALFVLSMWTASATASPVRTYGYISHVEGTQSGTATDFPHDLCTFTVRIPRTPVDSPPKGSGSELLVGAATAYDYTNTEPHEEFDCDSFEHTWQLISPDSHDKDRVHIQFPAGRPDWVRRIIFIALGLYLLHRLIERKTGKSLSLMRYPAWRAERRLARMKKRAAKASAEQLPRAQVVETKHDGPPSD